MENTVATIRAREDAKALPAALEREQRAIPSQLHQAVETGNVDRYVALRFRKRAFRDHVTIEMPRDGIRGYEG